MSVDETPSKYALDTVIKEFMDTPTEKDILHFKTLILRNFQHFDTWYEAQFSVIDGSTVYRKARQKLLKNSTLIISKLLTNI